MANDQKIRATLLEKCDALKQIAATSVDPHDVAKYIALSTPLVIDTLVEKMSKGYHHVATQTDPLMWNQKFAVTYTFQKDGDLLADNQETLSFTADFLTGQATEFSPDDIGEATETIPFAAQISSDSAQVIASPEALMARTHESETYFQDVMGVESFTPSGSHQIDTCYQTAVLTATQTQYGTGNPPSFDTKADAKKWDGSKTDTRKDWQPDPA